MTMRERLIDILKNKPYGYSSYEDFADYLLANGVIVPPCKVDDTVYEIQPMRKRVQAYKIISVKYNGRFWTFYWVVRDGKGIYVNVDGFDSNELGKTVFLTRAEAEKALKEREKYDKT